MKTDGYTRDQIGRVVQLRTAVEGLKLSEGVIRPRESRVRCGTKCA